MKKIAGIALITTLWMSCGGEEKKTDENKNDANNDSKTEIDLRGTYEHILNANGNDITLMVPEEYANTGARLEPVDSASADGIQWAVMVGDKYHLTLEDIEGTDVSVAKEKKRMEALGIYNLEYLVDEKDLIMYKAELKNGAGQKPYFHVFGIVKVNGKPYSVKSYELGDFNKGQAEKMLTTLRALQQPS